MMKFHSTVLIVKDIDVSKQFYVNILECNILHDYGKNIGFEGGLSIWELRDSHIISKKVDTLNVDSTKFEVYFETEDIFAICEKIKERGVIFLHEIHEEPWGQLTIRFFDPDNHLIEIGETVPTFINRLHKSGLSVAQISNKAYMDEESIKLIII